MWVLPCCSLLIGSQSKPTLWPASSAAADLGVGLDLQLILPIFLLFLLAIGLRRWETLLGALFAIEEQDAGQDARLRQRISSLLQVAHDPDDRAGNKALKRCLTELQGLYAPLHWSAWWPRLGAALAALQTADPSGEGGLAAWTRSEQRRLAEELARPFEGGQGAQEMRIEATQELFAATQLFLGRRMSYRAELLAVAERLRSDRAGERTALYAWLEQEAHAWLRHCDSELQQRRRDACADLVVDAADTFVATAGTVIRARRLNLRSFFVAKILWRTGDALRKEASVQRRLVHDSLDGMGAEHHPAASVVQPWEAIDEKILASQTHARVQEFIQSQARETDRENLRAMFALLLAGESMVQIARRLGVRRQGLYEKLTLLKAHLRRPEEMRP